MHASALMLAFGGMRGIPRSEAQRGCRGARVRVRSRSRHARVEWWCRSVRAPVRVYVAGKPGMVAFRVRAERLVAERGSARLRRPRARRARGKRAGRAKKGPCGSAMELYVLGKFAVLVTLTGPYL